MDLGLRGRTALVTGGTRGVGRGVVLALARQGVAVYTCYRSDRAAAARLAGELRELGVDHHVARVDLGRPAEVRRLTDDCARRFGHLDIVVNNAAKVDHARYAELSPDAWRSMIAVNLTAVHLVVQGVLPLLGPGSSVIGVSSLSVETGVPLLAHYNAAKAGVYGLHRSLARELGPAGVRVNLLALGIVETDALRSLPPQEYARRTGRYRAATPLARLGRADDVAGAVLWLASDLSTFVTGAVVPIDGGIG